MRIKTTIWLDEKQMRSLEKLSDATGAPKAELIRRAIDRYLGDEQAKARKGGRR